MPPGIAMVVHLVHPLNNQGIVVVAWAMINKTYTLTNL